MACWYMRCERLQNWSAHSGNHFVDSVTKQTIDVRSDRSRIQTAHEADVTDAARRGIR